MPKKQNRPAQYAATSYLKKLDIVNFFDSLTFGVLFVGLDHRVIAINRFLEALTGYNREEVKGVLGENVLRSNLASLGNPIHTTLSNNKPLTIEGDIINQSRKKTPIRFTISPLRLQNGKNGGVIVVLEDISILKDLDNKVHSFSGKDELLGSSKKMQEIFELLPIAARTDASVLITGETGTGKDLVAEAIHKTSKRSRYPFIKVNCGALPESLLESELFGHVRGAFTGADKDKPGMFRLAHGGTLFLTEIGDLSLPLQVKILTVLDDKEFFPVGGSKKVGVDVRIIAATHRDLSALVKSNKFREDLFYRLNVLRLHLPPLREREDDFRLLLDHFLRKFCAGLHKKIKGYSAASLKMLSLYHYPGNVRELSNIVEYAANVCPVEMIEPEHLPQYILSLSADSPAETLCPEGGSEGIAATHRPARQDFPDPATMQPPEKWEEVERKMILQALTKTSGNRSRAANLLGWSRSKLWRKIKQHDLK